MCQKMFFFIFFLVAEKNRFRADNFFYFSFATLACGNLYKKELLGKKGFSNVGNMFLIFGLNTELISCFICCNNDLICRHFYFQSLFLILLPSFSAFFKDTLPFYCPCIIYVAKTAFVLLSKNICM